MSEFSQLPGVHPDPAESQMPLATRLNGSDRRVWIAPSMAPHSTMTTLTQSALPLPLSLLFLQSSTQCFDQDGNPVLPCPPT
jgi:hypothetical protein